MTGTLSFTPESAPSTWVLGVGGSRGQGSSKTPSKSTPSSSTTRFRARDKIRRGPQVGGSTAWGGRNTSERGAKSQVDHKWAQWVHNPCRLGGPQGFRAGEKIRSGPQGASGYITPAAYGVSKASERGQNQKGPISGPMGLVATCMHFLFSGKLENFCCRKFCTKNLSCHGKIFVPEHV